MEESELELELLVSVAPSGGAGRMGVGCEEVE